MEYRALCQSKLGRLLDKFMTAECPTRIGKDLDKLLAHLWRQENRGRSDETSVIAFPIFTQWLKKTICEWNRNEAIPSSANLAFVLNLTGLLSTNENRFCELNTNNFFIRLLNLSKTKLSDASIKSAYVKLLSAFLGHRSGAEWLAACNFWENVFCWCMSGHVVQESTLFVAKFLENTIECDRTFCECLVRRIMTLLGDNIYRFIETTNDLKDCNEDIVLEHLKPVLVFLGNVLEYLLEKSIFNQKDFDVLLTILKVFNQDQRHFDLMLITQVKGVVFDIWKIMLIVQLLEVYNKVNANSEDVDSAVRAIHNNFIVNLSKGNFQDVTKFIDLAMLQKGVVESKMSTQNKGTKQLLEVLNQFVLLVTLPQFGIVEAYCFRKAEWVAIAFPDDIRETYIHKMIKTLKEDSMRLYFSWRNYFTNTPNLFEICTANLNTIKRRLGYFSRDQAISVFQMLIYLTKDIISSIRIFPEKLPFFQSVPDYFELLFELTALLINEFKITWTDSFETIDVMVQCFDFLTMPGWSPVIVVELLNLINVATAKYMAPNLALLIDSTSNSSLALLGPVLFAKFHDPAVEVKRAAAEVGHTVARMSRSQFPSLQKVLMDSELPTLVVKMSTHDGESFVRATAIKCLQEMIQVEDIWNNALKTEDLPQKMSDILLNETEGIVRVEAATFMCVAYKHQQFPKNTLNKIYETMIYASTVDLHWEVKVRSLDFWDKVIKNHLQNQGMIDGSFPNVTFSKEHRKIVTLTDSEIKKRLLKVLGQLSAIGCLGVLVSAIKDDCDMEVSKTGAKITEPLVDLFKKYNVTSDSSTPTSPMPTETGTSCAASVSSGISVDESMTTDSPAFIQHDLHDEVIDQIVNSNDSALLRNVYTSSDYGSVNNYDIQVRKIVSPNQFLEFTQQDLSGIINEKKNWLNGIEDLGSLLDDMLKTYENDINSMDCY